MKLTALLLLLSLLLVGCQPGGEANAANNSATSSDPSASTNPSGQPGAQTTPTGNSGGVAPMASGAAGGMTPMSGTESVQGDGGGSVGMAAKDYAKRKIGSGAGSGSVSQAPTDESSQ